MHASYYYRRNVQKQGKNRKPRNTTTTIIVPISVSPKVTENRIIIHSAIIARIIISLKKKTETRFLLVIFFLVLCYMNTLDKNPFKNYYTYIFIVSNCCAILLSLLLLLLRKVRVLSCPCTTLTVTKHHFLHLRRFSVVSLLISHKNYSFLCSDMI